MVSIRVIGGRKKGHAADAPSCDFKKFVYICKKTAPMTLNEKVQYWKELSDYDLETAEAML
jgi:hypothetical protein